MPNEINKVILIGRMTRDPEFKVINQSGVANFSIANNRTYVSNGEKKDEVHFFDCEAWGKLADILKQYAKKGTKVAIEGRLKQSTWETPDGKKASKVRIFVETFQFLGSSQSGGQNSAENNSGSSYSNQQTSYDMPPDSMYAEDEDDIF
ncbi:MAG: single-stranded DNA-binding protein [Leptospiraceae bacterium]|nr:single-stranded DNA-binding protein [Leptospiraceae bacterium]MCP5503441.1 single-stranded DNA-binding protein [Leptospiraceae bacterium]